MTWLLGGQGLKMQTPEDSQSESGGSDKSCGTYYVGGRYLLAFASHFGVRHDARQLFWGDTADTLRLTAPNWAETLSKSCKMG